MSKIYKILELIKPEVNFRDETSFIQENVLDSLDIIKLVVALEEEFSISIDTEEILPDNFESVEDISKLIKKHGGVI